MCGITGFISAERYVPDEGRAAVLASMCRSIVHRGPDERGTLVSGRAALGMQRLSVIDLKSGQQPIFTEDKSLAIVFNGEIYNFRKVRKELEGEGYRFRTSSDTEVVVNAFHAYGLNSLKRLRGMFAFAIWDFRSETLYMARDRVGKKPLYYTLDESGNFVFGSELKSLLAYGAAKRRIDYAALDAYLTFGYVPEEFCIFDSVQKLPPGHSLTFKDGKVSIESYWDFNYDGAQEIKSETEYIELLREKLEDAVRVRLISDVPLGAFLSGGVDSSTTVAMMSKLSDQPVKTFSIGFKEDSFDELKYARVAAKHFGTDHHEFVVTPDLVDIVDELVWHFDEPFADSSALPTYMVSKMAREYVTVVLSGDGGDELFGGYTRYVIDQKREAFGDVPEVFRSGVIRPLSNALPHGARGKNYLYNISLNPIDRYIDSVSQFNTQRKESLYSKDFRASLNGEFGAGERRFKDYAQSVSTGSPIDKLLYLDSKTYLPGDILTKVDRMSMANSLEARAPLLDHELIELVVAMPPEMKIKGGETKYILKKAMEGIVPNEILYREKQGFGVPIREWINRQLRTRINDELSDRRTLDRGYFERSYINKLLDEHSKGRRDHSHALWTLWMLELWHRKFLDA